MASWMTHIRIAEKLIMKDQFDRDSFLIGNIAPDSGVPDGYNGFTPPKVVTHFKDKNISYILYDHINPEAFINNYLKQRIVLDVKEQSFLIGYYIHLLTDIYWHQLIMNKKICDQVLREEIETNPKDFRDELKMLDLIYIKQAHNIYDSLFTRINHCPDYLNYFREGSITNHLKTIKNFYSEQIPIKESFRYVTNEEMSCFIDYCIKEIDAELDHLQGCISEIKYTS